jgi:formate dehydrogenase major subunit
MDDRRKEHASMAATLTRLTEPLVREDGVLRTATWDEALDRAAQGLRRAMGRNPHRGAGIFSCSKATNEMNYVAQKFARRVLGTNNIDSCNRT